MRVRNTQMRVRDTQMQVRNTQMRVRNKQMQVRNKQMRVRDTQMQVRNVLSVSSTRRALWSCRSPSTKRDGTKPGAASDYVSVVTMGISKGGGNRWRVEGRGSGVVESGAPTRGRCHKGRCLEKGDGFRRAGKTSPYPVGAANGGRRVGE